MIASVNIALSGTTDLIALNLKNVFLAQSFCLIHCYQGSTNADSGPFFNINLIKHGKIAFSETSQTS